MELFFTILALSVAAASIYINNGSATSSELILYSALLFILAHDSGLGRPIQT